MSCPAVVTRCHPAHRGHCMSANSRVNAAPGSVRMALIEHVEGVYQIAAETDRQMFALVANQYRPRLELVNGKLKIAVD